MTRLPLPSARNKNARDPTPDPCSLKTSSPPTSLCLSLDPSLAASSVADSARRAASYGGDGGSAGEAARRAAAPPRAVGASAARGRPPHARPPRRVPARGRRVRGTRSPQAVVPPAGRRGPVRRRGDVRRWDRGAAGQAHGPPARRGRPATRAPLAASSAEEGRESAAGDGLRARARAPGAASASAPASAPTASSSNPAAGDARGRRHHEAVEPAGAHASAARRQVVGRVGAALVVAVSEAAQARPVLRVSDGGGDRGGHLRADRRQAAAAAEEAAARRTAAARYALPRAVAHRDHRRRVPSAGRVAAPAPACRRRQLSSKPSDSNHLTSLVGRLIASQSRLLSAHRAGRALVNWSAAPPAPSFSARRMV